MRRETERESEIKIGNLIFFVTWIDIVDDDEGVWTLQNGDSGHPPSSDRHDVEVCEVTCFDLEGGEVDLIKAKIIEPNYMSKITSKLWDYDY